MAETTVRSWVAGSIIMTVLLSVMGGAAFGQEEKGELTIGVKSRIDWWETSKEKYDHQAFGGGGYFDPTTIESKESDMGLLVGPELPIYLSQFFCEGILPVGKQRSFRRRGSRQGVSRCRHWIFERYRRIHRLSPVGCEFRRIGSLTDR